MRTTIGFTPTVDVDLSKPLAWPNLVNGVPDGTVTVWPKPGPRITTWAEREPDLPTGGSFDLDAGAS